MPVRWPSVDRDATASAEDVEEQFDLLVEANDHLLEQVVSCSFVCTSCSWIKKISAGIFHPLNSEIASLCDYNFTVTLAVLC